MRALIIVAFALLANELVAASFNDINKFLVEKCPNAEFECNIKAAKELLAVEESKSCILRGKSCDRLKTLISLEQAIESCDTKARDILAANGEMVGNPQKKLQSKFYTRLETLVLEAMRSHAHRCCLVYYDNIPKDRGQLNDGRVKLVDELTSKMVYVRRHIVFPGLMPEDAKWVYPHFVRAVEKREPGAKFESLIADEVSGKLNKEKFAALYQKYLVEPCRFYAQSLRHIFEPALFDACPNLSEPLQQYKLCKEIAEDKSASKSLMKNMAALASKPAKYDGFARRHDDY